MKFEEGTVFFDFDATQVEVEIRVDMEIAAAMRYGMQPGHFLQGRELAVREFGLSRFDYKKLYLGCKKMKPDLDEAVVEEWYDIIRTPMLFPDTIPALELIPKSKRVMLTTGDPEFQNIKIDANGVREYFSRIMIVGSPKCDALADTDIPPGAGFVDDSPREIDAMKARHPGMFCVQARRPAPWEHQKVSLYKDIHAEDLYSAVLLIKNKDRLV